MSSTSRSSTIRCVRSSSVSDGPTMRSRTSGTSATARSMVTRPFAGDVRPSASSVSGSRSGRLMQGRSVRSMPCPTATSLRVRIGNVRGSTERTTLDSRVAVESSVLRRQWLNQSITLTPVGRAIGAASTA